MGPTNIMRMLLIGIVVAILYYITYLYNNSLIKDMNIKLSTQSPIYWVPTQEGILSQLSQLQTLYNIATITSRKVIIESFQSPVHYGNEEINLCDYFLFPNIISCMNHSDFAYTKNCVIIGNKKSHNHTS